MQERITDTIVMASRGKSSDLGGPTGICRGICQVLFLKLTGTTYFTIKTESKRTPLAKAGVMGEIRT